MSKIPKVSETTIRQHAATDPFSRGRQYYQQGAVSGLRMRGGQLLADVEGSEYEPYRVRVTFDDGGITAVTCTCPYDLGGWCKHIVATLLVCVHRPESIEVLPTLEALLSGLDREQLQTLLLEVAAHNPNVADAIDFQLSLLKASPSLTKPTTSPANPPRHTPVDPQPIRRQMRSILRPAGYGYASGAVEQVQDVLDQAQRFTEGGDAGNALILLEAITDEYVEHWYDVDDSDGELGAFFEELATVWADALLSAELPRAERQKWSKKLAHWQREADEYGAESWFEMARVAADQGWDDPALQRVLQGATTAQDTFDDEPGDYVEELVPIRLKVLERQGRTQEYLYLAQAEGEIEAYVTMLARMGRVPEAVDEGLRSLTTANAALALARVLRERGELEAVVRIAEYGLSLDEPTAPLADWLADLAESLGKRSLALRAAEIAFRSAPSLSAYLKVRDLAGEGWPGVRTAFLDHLRGLTSPWMYTAARVDVFLHEELIDDAINMVQDSSSYGLLERVMDAAIRHRPDWVITAATTHAERIINAGQAKHYDHAIDWLKRARDAYRAAGRPTDWQRYVARLREEHGRKYKLMGLMQQL